MSNRITLTLCTASAVVISNFIVPSVSGRRKQKIWIIQAHYKKNSTVEVSYYSNTQLYIGPIWNYSKSIKNWYKKCNCFCHFYSGNWIKSFCPRSSVWSSWSFGGLVKFKHLRTLNTGLTLAQFFVSQPFA